MFGWSDEQLAELRKEPISKVTFEIEPVGAAVKLTVRHDGFPPDSEMLKGVSQGWPVILSNLKSVLETDETLSLAPDTATQGASGAGPFGQPRQAETSSASGCSLVMLGQDGADLAGPVGDGALANLATHDRELRHGHREAGGGGVFHRSL